MQPYQTYREYFRGVFIAIGLFLVAAEFAAWVTPVLELVIPHFAAYTVSFSTGMMPFMFFARRAGALDFDLLDLFGLMVTTVIFTVVFFSLRPRLAAVDIPDIVLWNGVFLVCLVVYNLVRHWLFSWLTSNGAKDS